jgi:LmbE family N-acetylglucosaminyl deacetylase
MSRADPSEVFAGTTIVIVPHMDDCVLACGGTIARLPDRRRVHIVYATDGRGAPAPELPWRDKTSADLMHVRENEARAAMALLGLPAENVHFLRLPDGRLRQHLPALRESVARLIARLEPARVLVPFRFDRHPDHLAVNAVLTSPRRGLRFDGGILEYFVYHRWRLLPRGDIRQYIPPDDLLEVDILDVCRTKRAALALFRSQTTRFYEWQSRPNLMPELLDTVSREPETFLRYDPARRGAKVFGRSRIWIRIAHRLEPVLKKHKDRVVAVCRRVLARPAGRDPIR